MFFDQENYILTGKKLKKVRVRSKGKEVFKKGNIRSKKEKNGNKVKRKNEYIKKEKEIEIILCHMLPLAEMLCKYS